MNYLKTIFGTTALIVMFALHVPFAGARSLPAPPNDTNENVISAFQLKQEVGPFVIKVPTIVEVPVSFDTAGESPMVFDVTDDSFKDSHFEKNIPYHVGRVTVKPNANVSGRGLATDGSLSTYTSVSLPDSRAAEVTFEILSDKPFSSSQLTVNLASNVVLPETIEISAENNGQKVIVLAESEMNSSRVSFPSTEAEVWHITFTINQPLRVSELELLQQKNGGGGQSVRFLAHPEHEYVVYYDHDRSVRPIVRGVGSNLANPSSLIVANGDIEPNPAYVPADTDGDGVINTVDNCVSIANPDQIDINDNGIGDVCDDFDSDGDINSEDNCPNDPNQTQQDTDNDGIGDVCDEEESRFTEKYPWIPWVGIGFAGLVLVILFGITAQATFHKKEEDLPLDESNSQL